MIHNYTLNAETHDITLVKIYPHSSKHIQIRKESIAGEILIDNEASIRRLAEISVAFAHEGADIVAPSDMMDGRIAAIKDGLNKSGLGNKVVANE